MEGRRRYVDLSHVLLPGKEEFHLELETHFTGEICPQYMQERGVEVAVIDPRGDPLGPPREVGRGHGLHLRL